MWSKTLLNKAENITQITLVKIILFIPSENQIEVGKKQAHLAVWLTKVNNLNMNPPSCDPWILNQDINQFGRFGLNSPKAPDAD